MDDTSPELQRLEPSNAARKRRPWELYARRERTIFLWMLFLVGTSSYVDKNVIGVVLEPIKAEFQVSDTMLGLLSGIAFALFYATAGIPVARWADRGDRKLAITLSLCAWSVMTVLCGLATTFWQLMVARFGVGTGEAGAIPPAQSLLADYYPPLERARAMGVFMMSAAGGYIIGLMLGGFIAQSHGWRAVFIIFGLAGLALAPLAHFILKEPRHTRQFALQADGGEPMVAAVRALFAKPAYRALLVSIVIFFLVSYGALVFVVSLIIRVHGVNVAQAGGIYGATVALGVVIGSVGGGALADRLAVRDIAWLARVAGWGLMATIPLYELAFCSPNIITMVPFLLLGAVVISSAIPPAFSAVHVVCGSKRRALAVALVLFFANLIGLGLGPVIAGALSDRFGAVYGSAEGLRYALMIVTIVLLPSSLLMLRAARYLKRDAED